MDTPSAAPAAPAAPAASSSSSPTPSASASPGGAPAQANAAPSAAPPARIRWKDTVNGQEQEFDASEDELRASYRKSKVADQRFEQAAKLRNEAQEAQNQLAQLQQQFKSNPRAVVEFLRNNGVEDPLDFMANALQSELVEAERLQDPNVRAREEAERELEVFRQKERERELHQTTEKFDAQVTAEMGRIASVFDAALALVSVPADDDTLQIMAQLESENRRRGLNLTPERLAKATEDRVLRRSLKVYEKMSDEALLALDPAFTKRLTKAITDDWKKKRAATNQVQAPPQAAAPAANAEPARRMTDKEEHEATFGRRALRTI